MSCIIFEESSENTVPPLVYVQDFSTNGTYLTRRGSELEQKLSRRDGKILISAGDVVRISPLCALRFDYSGIVVPGVNDLPSDVRRQAEV